MGWKERWLHTARGSLSRTRIREVYPIWSYQSSQLPSVLLTMLSLDRLQRSLEIGGIVLSHSFLSGPFQSVVLGEDRSGCSLVEYLRVWSSQQYILISKLKQIRVPICSLRRSVCSNVVSGGVTLLLREQICDLGVLLDSGLLLDGR